MKLKQFIDSILPDYAEMVVAYDSSADEHANDLLFRMLEVTIAFPLTSPDFQGLLIGLIGQRRATVLGINTPREEFTEQERHRHERATDQVEGSFTSPRDDAKRGSHPCSNRISEGRNSYHPTARSGRIITP